MMITPPPVGAVLIPVTANQDFCMPASARHAQFRVRKHGEVFPPRERERKSTFKTTRFKTSPYFFTCINEGTFVRCRGRARCFLLVYCMLREE